MRDLSHLLKRFKESLDKDVVAREEIASCVKDLLGFEVRLADISIKGDTLRIKTSPPKRNAIKLEEAKLLREIQHKTKLNLKRISY
jgi:hypothetical protein